MPRLQPILWKPNALRYYGKLNEVQAIDRPWHEKNNFAVYRGAWTGVAP